DLPMEIQPAAAQRAETPVAPAALNGHGLPLEEQIAAQRSLMGELLWQRMLDGESFWTVAEMYKAHDITRADLRMLIHRRLQHTRGNYRALVGVFNLPAHEYKRFQAFLFQHKCNLPFRTYRSGENTESQPDRKRAFEVAS